MKKIILVLAISSAFMAINANAIVVYDPTASGNAARQILETKKQLDQLKAQVDQAKVLYQSLNGTRGIVDLLKNPVVINSLPQNYQDVYRGISNDKNSKWADLYKLSTDYKNMTNDTLKQAYQKNLEAYDNSINDYYDATSKRLNTLNQLAQKINQTKDPKEIADLQARIAVEQGAINIDKTRLDMLREMKQLKTEMLKQNASNRWHESLKKPFVMPDIHVDIKKP